MASKPHPSWSEPQKKVFKQIQEATELAIPYFGPEIPVLDNLTDEQMCDQVGLLKAARKAFLTAENSHVERFKIRLGSRGDLRGDRYEATYTGSERTALIQSTVKTDILERADTLGINLERLLDAVADGKVKVPNDVKLDENESTNMMDYHGTEIVKTLRVEEIA